MGDFKACRIGIAWWTIGECRGSPPRCRRLQRTIALRQIECVNSDPRIKKPPGAKKRGAAGWKTVWARKSLAWLGLAWLGLAWLGLAWLGLHDTYITLKFVRIFLV